MTLSSTGARKLCGTLQSLLCALKEKKKKRARAHGEWWSPHSGTESRFLRCDLEPPLKNLYICTLSEHRQMSEPYSEKRERTKNWSKMKIYERPTNFQEMLLCWKSNFMWSKREYVTNEPQTPRSICTCPLLLRLLLPHTLNALIRDLYIHIRTPNHRFKLNSNINEWMNEV